MNSYFSLSQLSKFVGTILVVLLLASESPALPSPGSPAESSFCACCADPGLWSLENRKIDEGTMKELNRLKPDGVADFYVTDAWPDNVSGVAVPDSYQPGYFVVSIVREQRAWKFFFKTPKGETGALVLTLPAIATFFDADIEPRQKLDSKVPLVIYKEVRLEGDVRGTGIFAKGIAARTKFRLILQGRGNRCLNAEDVHRWNLRISGPQAGYTIYGSFAKPST